MRQLVNFTVSLSIVLAIFLCGCETSQPAEPHPHAATAAGGCESYLRVVQNVYYRAWHPLQSQLDYEHVTQTSITIARSGHVLSARVVHPSGDVWMDKSVRAALDRVQFVAPFENGAKESQRTLIINFDSKAAAAIKQ